MSIESVNSKILGPTEPIKQSLQKVQSRASGISTDSLDQAFNPRIQKVLSTSPQVDPVDISQIRQELDSGLYDSPEMIWAAARQIAKLGV